MHARHAFVYRISCLNAPQDWSHDRAMLQAYSELNRPLEEEEEEEEGGDFDQLKDLKAALSAAVARRSAKGSMGAGFGRCGAIQSAPVRINSNDCNIDTNQEEFCQAPDLLSSSEMCVEVGTPLAPVLPVLPLLQSLV